MSSKGRARLPPEAPPPPKHHRGGGTKVLADAEAAEEAGEAAGDVAPLTPTAGAPDAAAVVEYARSPRAACRVCGEHIAQGELRLGCACVHHARNDGKAHRGCARVRFCVPLGACFARIGRRARATHTRVR